VKLRSKLKAVGYKHEPPQLVRFSEASVSRERPELAHLDGGIRSASWPFLPFANVE
jgi:hypothetical protein